MTAHNGNTEQDERGLLPYPVLIVATKGDPEAMKIVVQHYESYIASPLSAAYLYPAFLFLDKESDVNLKNISDES